MTFDDRSVPEEQSGNEGAPAPQDAGTEAKKDNNRDSVTHPQDLAQALRPHAETELDSKLNLLPGEPGGFRYDSALVFARWCIEMFGSVQVVLIHRDGKSAQRVSRPKNSRGWGNSKTPARRFTTKSTDDDILSWIGQNRDGWNTYWSVNPTQNSAEKGTKDDVTHIAMAHVDADGDRETNVAQLQQLGVSFAIDSGNGFWGLRLLKESIRIAPFVNEGGILAPGGEVAMDPGERDSAIRDIEARNRHLRDQFNGGDSTQNVDRIARLPGTINWPNAKKEARGCRPTVSRLVVPDGPMRLFSMDEMPADHEDRPKARAGGTVNVDVGNVRRVADLNELSENVADRVKSVIVHGKDDDQPLQGDNSRSEWLFFVVCSLVRAGIDDETIYAIITDPDFRISDSVRDKGGQAQVHRYAMRQIQRAKEHDIQPELAELNDEYALVESVGAKARIMREFYDPALGQMDVEFLLVDGFNATYGNRFVMTTKQTSTGTTTVPVPLGKWWMTHPNRRSYKTVTFAPGKDVDSSVLNLWTGFGFDPKPGDCSLYLAHLKDNVCQSDQARYDYLIGWMANAVQNPGDPGQVAVVLRGSKGTGKNEAARHFGKLWGRHYKEVTNPEHVVGKFNATLKDAAVIVADECFVPKNKAHESALKAMITNERIAVEMKGVDVQQRRNCTHLLMLTNDEWAVPASHDERRYFVSDMGTAKRRDRTYFGAIDEQMREGGYEALLQFLMAYDLSGFDVTAVPETAALDEQKSHSLVGTLEGEWLECLIRGELPTGVKDQCSGHVEVGTTNLLAAWEPRIGGKAAQSGPLRALLDSPQGNHSGKGMEFPRITSTPRGYRIPPLAEARRRWDERRWTVQWDDCAEWTVLMRMPTEYRERPQAF